MTVYEAINQMRVKSQRGETFSITFMSYSETTGKSTGITTVDRAKLASRSKDNNSKNAEIMESYTNMDTGEIRHFYQALLMIYNGKKTELK